MKLEKKWNQNKVEGCTARQDAFLVGYFFLSCTSILLESVEKKIFKFEDSPFTIESYLSFIYNFRLTFNFLYVRFWKEFLLFHVFCSSCLVVSSVNNSRIDLMSSRRVKKTFLLRGSAESVEALNICDKTHLIMYVKAMIISSSSHFVKLMMELLERHKTATRNTFSMFDSDRRLTLVVCCDIFCCCYCFLDDDHHESPFSGLQNSKLNFDYNI